ncbi:VOC family protein [Pseudomonas aeruginosa]|uniref:VOC family protein n=1 Tax=Pseudomonas aeruginosa TaxID=287 RepID=UPI00104E7E23|nr:VOC family protein [Pseudomonas aeruginosa]
MLTGLNHLTLAVADLPASIAFYRDLLGFRLEARWDLEAHVGDLRSRLAACRQAPYAGMRFAD